MKKKKKKKLGFEREFRAGLNMGTTYVNESENLWLGPFGKFWF